MARGRQRLRLWSCRSPAGPGPLLPSRFPACFRSGFVTAGEGRARRQRGLRPRQGGTLHTAAGTHRHRVKSGFRMSRKHVLYSDKRHTWLSDFVIKHCERRACFEKDRTQQRPQWPRPGLGGGEGTTGVSTPRVTPVTGRPGRGAVQGTPSPGARVPSGFPGICT